MDAKWVPSGANIEPVMLPLERFVLESLLDHATAAARLVGHLDDCREDLLVGLLSDHIDAIAHELNELLNDPRRISSPLVGERSVLAATTARDGASHAGGDR
jgi:hypothetical protein